MVIAIKSAPPIVNLWEYAEIINKNPIIKRGYSIPNAVIGLVILRTPSHHWLRRGINERGRAT
jgi:hypothetical protein